MALMGRDATVVYPALEAKNRAYVEINYAPKQIGSEWIENAF